MMPSLMKGALGERDRDRWLGESVAESGWMKPVKQLEPRKAEPQHRVSGASAQHLVRLDVDSHAVKPQRWFKVQEGFMLLGVTVSTKMSQPDAETLPSAGLCQKPPLSRADAGTARSGQADTRNVDR